MKCIQNVRKNGGRNSVTHVKYNNRIDIYTKNNRLLKYVGGTQVIMPVATTLTTEDDFCS